MAVYTQLTRNAVSLMGAVFPEVGGDVVDVEGIPQGSINTTYKVTAREGRVWFLRVNEGKKFEELLHERDLLLALSKQKLGAVTPRMALSVPGGSFFPVDIEAQPRKWASFFPALPGRDLGVFEVTPAHTHQVGAFMARAHIALRGFRRRRRNPYGLPVVAAWLENLRAMDVLPDVTKRLTQELSLLRRLRRPLPRGLIHGDLFVDNTKWEGGALAAVFDWEMAGRDHLALDLSVALCAWCFKREGEAMVLREAEAAALVDGYQSVRKLEPSEKRGFFYELRFASLRFTASRIRDFEVPGREGSERRYLDYRDFSARLDTLQGRGDRALRSTLGLR